MISQVESEFTLGKIAIIGGTGLSKLDAFDLLETIEINTPYGETSSPIQKGKFFGKPIYFLPRHGNSFQIAPHKINYRANIFALQSLEIETVIAVNAVGGIVEKTSPSSLLIPDQIIDYTWGREATFYDGEHEKLQFVDFSFPYSKNLREILISLAEAKEISIVNGGIYGCTQGPRLETAAEIARCKRDGCSVVGMTGMPEAVLAKELGLNYSSICIVVNWAAGINQEAVSMKDIEIAFSKGLEPLKLLISELVEKYC